MSPFLAIYHRVEREGPLAPSLLDTGPAPEDTRDDYLLAQMLQLEYDKEHDLRLKAEEKHFNKHSHGTVMLVTWFLNMMTPYHFCGTTMVRGHHIHKPCQQLTIKLMLMAPSP